MEPLIKEFGHTLAGKALERDWEGVRLLLAPWLTLTTEEVQEFFESDYRETLKSSGVEEMHWPEVPYVSGNSSDLASLREKKDWMQAARPIAPEVTEANFRQWMTIQLQCSEEQTDELDFDYFTELWLIVCQTPEGLRVGYWSHSAY